MLTRDDIWPEWWESQGDFISVLIAEIKDWTHRPVQAYLPQTHTSWTSVNTKPLKATRWIHNCHIVAVTNESCSKDVWHRPCLMFGAFPLLLFSRKREEKIHCSHTHTSEEQQQTGRLLRLLVGFLTNRNSFSKTLRWQTEIRAKERFVCAEEGTLRQSAALSYRHTLSHLRGDAGGSVPGSMALWQ